jgi:hypothetical protein
MATQIDPKEFDLQEQLARIRKIQEESDKFSAETRKLLIETKTISFATIFQGLISVAALLGAGAAIAKLFFP